MKRALVAAAIALALAGCSAQPTAPAAPLMGQSSTTETPEPSATPEPSTTPDTAAYPHADEDAYLALVERDWQDGDPMPTTAEALSAGYERCDAVQVSRTADDAFFPQWSGVNNLMVQFAAETHLCPAQ